MLLLSFCIRASYQRYMYSYSIFHQGEEDVYLPPKHDQVESAFSVLSRRAPARVDRGGPSIAFQHFTSDGAT